MSNVNEKLQALKIKEQEAIDYCNTKLSAKGVTESATSVVDIGNKIESIEIVDPYQILQEKFFYPERRDYTLAFGNSIITDDDIGKIALDTSQGTEFTSMFSKCGNLTTIPQLDVSNGQGFNSMFSNCGNLITVPQLDTSKGTDFNGMFYNCVSLITISQLNINKAAICNMMFYNCYNLENISFVAECIKKTISFSNSDKLTDESIQSIIDGLAIVTTAQTITFHDTVKTKLTEEQIATINEKGWTLA